MTASETDQHSGEIVARVDFQYRWRTWVFFILVFGFGVWSLRDGFVKWPRENAAWDRMDARVDRPTKRPHDTGGVRFNQVLGIVLTVLSVPILAWRTFHSRGEYRLAGNTLYVPGHSPVPLERMRTIDLARWDQKGIALIEFEVPPRGSSSVTLNDMIYNRTATDRIVDRIKSQLNTQDAVVMDVETKKPEA